MARNYSIGHGLTYLECPCCGDNGAASDGEGSFYDGQSLICGCPGWVSVDADGSEDPWINNGDARCEKCDQAQCEGNRHVWAKEADAEGDTCQCGEWYRFSDRIELAPQG